jgi:hypothetical protein
LFLLYHQWLLLLLKLYLRGTCFFPSLSRSISPTERKDSRLHNETQHANPADQDFLSMSSFPSRLAPSSSPHRSSSSILNHHSLSLSLSLSLSRFPMYSTYLRSLFRSLAPCSQTPPQQSASIVSKRNPSQVQSKGRSISSAATKPSPPAQRPPRQTTDPHQAERRHGENHHFKFRYLPRGGEMVRCDGCYFYEWLDCGWGWSRYWS